MPDKTGIARNKAIVSPAQQSSMFVNSLLLLTWLAAGAVAFLPFASDTSPWDAITLHVPGNQGNWWHFLAGAPFFLAFPMIWILIRSLIRSEPQTPSVWRIVWLLVALSTAGTILVEVPFLLHLAGTSQWQRLIVLGLGFGVIIASAVILLVRRQRFMSLDACLLGLDTAWLANAALCLVVYAGAEGTPSSRSGWFVSMVIVWPVLVHLLWLFRRSFEGQAPA